MFDFACFKIEEIVERISSYLDVAITFEEIIKLLDGYIVNIIDIGKIISSNFYLEVIANLSIEELDNLKKEISSYLEEAKDNIPILRAEFMETIELFMSPRDITGSEREGFNSKVENILTTAFLVSVSQEFLSKFQDKHLKY